MISLIRTGICLSLMSLFLVSCSQKIEAQSQNVAYDIASEEYSKLAEKALRSIEEYEFKELYSMVSDDIEYYLPDGDAGTRTAMIGKKEFMGFWDSYLENSGNNDMTMTNMVLIPVEVKMKLAYSGITGNTVLCYFSLNMEFGEEETDVRMHWGLHFDDDNKIDRIYSYYDRTPIIAAAKRNILEK